MFIFISILSFVISVVSASFTILYFVRKEVVETRKEVVRLYAELKQDISLQAFQIELLKRKVNKSRTYLSDLLEEPWVKELMEEE